MSLPKRGSRRIVVNGVAYRYIIRSNPTYCQGNAWSNLTFAVELETGGQTVLLVDTGYYRPDNWLNKEGGVVKPTNVTAAIIKALIDGWKPDVPSSAYLLHLPDLLDTGILKPSRPK
jgi:hypothetical protein